MGFDVAATRGTHRFLRSEKVSSRKVHKVSTGRPHVVDAIKNGEIQLVVNTAGASGTTAQDGYRIRRAALKYQIPYATTVAGALAMARAIAALKEEVLSVRPIQDYTGAI
jgi:carbamoyl-phosphate synthase large subunit